VKVCSHRPPRNPRPRAEPDTTTPANPGEGAGAVEEHDMPKVAHTVPNRKLAELLRAQAAVLFQLAAALSDDTPETDDPIVRVVAHVGDAVPRRVVNAACAAGQVEGAAKRGKSWLARRSAVDGWLSASVQPTNDADALAMSWARGAR
jgi:hypothetical protein